MAEMFEVIEEKTFITVSAGDVKPGDINVDGAKCIIAIPHFYPSATGRCYVNIVWDDAPLVTHFTNAHSPVIIEEK